MQMSWQNVEGYSGATAVGAVVLVDLILIANAFADNLFPVINDYAKTATWAIVVAIPLLSLTYLLGLVCMGTAEVLLIWSCLVDGRALTNDAVAVTARGELVAGRFHQLRQEAELLAGGVIAFALLALGSALGAWRIQGWRRFLTAVAITAILLSTATIFLCLYRYQSAHRLASIPKPD